MTKDCNPEKSKWIVKSNNYIEAKFTNYKPTLAQNRIALWLAAQVHSQKDEEFKDCHMTAEELRDLVGSRYTTKQIIEQLVELRAATAVIKTGTKWEVIGIINKATYDEITKKISFCLSEEMRPYLLNLSGEGGFTRFELNHIQKMRSVNSQRIYELLCQYRNLGRGDKRTIKISDLKEYLGLKWEKKGIVKEKFARWAEFDRVVLQQAERDLCNSGMFMNYIPVKTGNKITAIDFYFSAHKDIEGVILPAFKKLTLHPIDDYDKVRLSNMYDETTILKAIIECSKTKDEKPLIALLPKTRKQYLTAIKKRIEESLSPQGDLNLDGN